MDIVDHIQVFECVEEEEEAVMSNSFCSQSTDFDFLAFCGLEETAEMTTNVLDKDGAERPQLPHSLPWTKVVDLTQN